MKLSVSAADAIRKALMLALAVSLVFSLSACSKKKSPYEVADEFMQSVQGDGGPFIRILNFSEPYGSVIGKMIGELEYEILEEEAHSTGATGFFGEDIMGIKVRFKGYDLGSYMQQYLDRMEEEALSRLLKDHTVPELAMMTENDSERFQKIYLDACVEYFTLVMEGCRSQGKTLVVEGYLPMYYDEKNKQWKIDPLHQNAVVDKVTGGLYEIMKELREEAKSVS